MENNILILPDIDGIIWNLVLMLKWDELFYKAIIKDDDSPIFFFYRGIGYLLSDAKFSSKLEDYCHLIICSKSYTQDLDKYLTSIKNKELQQEFEVEHKDA